MIPADKFRTGKTIRTGKTRTGISSKRALVIALILVSLAGTLPACGSGGAVAGAVIGAAIGGAIGSTYDDPYYYDDYYYDEYYYYKAGPPAFDNAW